MAWRQDGLNDSSRPHHDVAAPVSAILQYVMPAHDSAHELGKLLLPARGERQRLPPPNNVNGSASLPLPGATGAAPDSSRCAMSLEIALAAQCWRKRTGTPAMQLCKRNAHMDACHSDLQITMQLLCQSPFACSPRGALAHMHPSCSSMRVCSLAFSRSPRDIMDYPRPALPLAAACSSTCAHCPLPITAMRLLASAMSGTAVCSWQQMLMDDLVLRRHCPTQQRISGSASAMAEALSHVPSTLPTQCACAANSACGSEVGL